MNQIKLLTKFYELVEVMGDNEVYALLERALKELKTRIAEDDIQHDVDEQRKSEWERANPDRGRENS